MPEADQIALDKVILKSSAAVRPLRPRGLEEEFLLIAHDAQANARSCKAERRMAHGLSSAVTPRLKARERSNPGYWWWAGRRDFDHAPRDRSRWFLRSRSSRRRRRMRALLACVATMNTATHSATSTKNGVSMASPAGRLRLLAGLECSELFLRLCCALHKQGLNIGQKLSCQF